MRIGDITAPTWSSVPTLMHDWSSSALYMKNEYLSEKMSKEVYVSTVVRQFLDIHPFTDLNGRTARVLSNALLVDINSPAKSVPGNFYKKNIV